MKQIKLIQAYRDLEQLSDVKDFHSKEQWAIYSLRKQLRSHMDFYEERQKAIVDKYSPHTDSEGRLKGQEYLDYVKDIEDLNNLEVDYTSDKITLPFVDGISFKTAEALDDFIEFTTEE